MAAITFARTYDHAHLEKQKQQICLDNKNKTGIYKWTHIISDKSSRGSSLDLSIRF